MTVRKKLPDKFAVKSTVRNRKLSRDRDRKHNMFLFKIVVVGILIAIPVFFHSWHRIRIVQYGYSIEEARNLAAQLKDTNMKLKLEKAQLSSLERVERIAQEKLKMEKPEVTDVTMVRVEEAPDNTMLASGRASE